MHVDSIPSVSSVQEAMAVDSQVCQIVARCELIEFKCNGCWIIPVVDEIAERKGKLLCWNSANKRPFRSH